MHIVIDARFYRSSTAGLGRYTRALINELIKLDNTNRYTIIITPDDEAEYDQQIRNLKFEVRNFSKIVVPIIHYTLSEQIKFVKILNDLKPDLVHFTNFNHPILYHGKFVTTVHDLTMMLYPAGKMQKSLFRRLAFKKVMDHAINSSDRVIAISEATKNDLIKYFHAKSKNIQVIYEGVDATYRSNSKLKTKNKKLWNNYKIFKPYLLFVSQWRPHKGLPELVKAFGILKEKYNQDIQLVITGKPNQDFPQLISSINNSPHVNDIIKPGFVKEEDLPVIFSASKAFIFPSHYEGFGLPPLEAMACGAPVVSSNASCMPEILGDAAEYFDPNNPADMADKINKILTEEQKNRETRIKKGFIQVKKYSWAKMAQETLEIYKKVLK